MAKLIIVTGPMFAGKTTRLVQTARAFPASTIRVFKPSIDTRYSTYMNVSHDGSEVPSILINREQPQIASYLSYDTRAVFIDELNFFSFETIYPEILSLLENDIHVFGMGLSYDFLQQPFGATLPLAAKADKVISLFARCDRCGKDAAHSYRKKHIDQYLVVGGAELYGACCDACYQLLS